MSWSSMVKCGRIGDVVGITESRVMDPVGAADVIWIRQRKMAMLNKRPPQSRLALVKDDIRKRSDRLDDFD